MICMKLQLSYVNGQLHSAVQLVACGGVGGNSPIEHLCQCSCVQLPISKTFTLTCMFTLQEGFNEPTEFCRKCHSLLTVSQLRTHVAECDERDFKGRVCND